ncbi:MAG: tol-pal system YbgF family protein [Sandaracinaceae bacterium]
MTRCLRAPSGANLFCGALVAALLVSSSADAQDTSADAEARALFDAGRIAYEQGHFDRALDAFSRSFELSGRREMLYNIGSTYDRLGRTAEAIAYLRRYLDEVPGAENGAFVRSRLEVLERAPPPEPAARQTDHTASIVLLAVGGALVLGSVATIAWWVDRNEAIDQCNIVACANGAALTTERDAAMGTTLAAAILGLTGIGIGIALFVVEDSDADHAALGCAPSLGGLRCEGRF